MFYMTHIELSDRAGTWCTVDQQGCSDPEPCLCCVPGRPKAEEPVKPAERPQPPKGKPAAVEQVAEPRTGPTTPAVRMVSDGDVGIAGDDHG